MLDRSKMVAFAYGYWDGRMVGLSNNPYQNAVLHMAYDDGYDLGVAEFCQYDESNAEYFDEENQQ